MTKRKTDTQKLNEKEQKIKEKSKKETSAERRQNRYVTVNVRLRKLTNPVTQLLGMHSLCQELSFNQGSNFHLQGEGSYLCRGTRQRQAFRMDTGPILASTKHSFTAPAFPQRSSAAGMTSAHATKASRNPSFEESRPFTLIPGQFLRHDCKQPGLHSKQGMVVSDQ